MIALYLKSLYRPILLLISLTVLSCTKENHVRLIDNSFHNLEINTGFQDNVVPVNSDDWQVEYVKLSTGEPLLDDMGNPMTLAGNGESRHTEGWITLKRSADGAGLSLSMLENFGGTPRTFLIGLIENGNKDVINITQRRGKGYKIANQQFQEIEGTQKVYTTDEDCLPLTLSNQGVEPKQMKTDDIFKNVFYTSEFVSDDYGAFDWFSENEIPGIFLPDLILDNLIVWSGEIPFQQGKVQDAYIGENKTSQSILVQPHTQVDLEGKMTYAVRSLAFTLTIQNEESGNRFDISGTCHQIVPITPEIIIKGVY